MTANSPNFGGWSDLQVSPDGKTLTSISDVGSWLTATVEYDGEGNLIGLKDGRIGSLLGLDGKPLVAARIEADAEGMALLPDGSWLVGFERHHRIWHYPTLDGVPTAINLPGRFRPPAVERRRRDHHRPARRPPHRDQRGVRACRPGLLVGWIGQPGGKDRYTWQSFRLHQDPRLQSDGDPPAARRRRSCCWSAPSTWCAACASAS